MDTEKIPIIGKIIPDKKLGNRVVYYQKVRKINNNLTEKKIMSNDKKVCPKCQQDLSDNMIAWKQEKKVFYTLSLGRKKLAYEKDESATYNVEGFYCKACGGFLDLEEKEVFEILTPPEIDGEEEIGGEEKEIEIE